MFPMPHADHGPQGRDVQGYCTSLPSVDVSQLKYYGGRRAMANTGRGVPFSTS